MLFSRSAPARRRAKETWRRRFFLLENYIEQPRSDFLVKNKNVKATVRKNHGSIALLVSCKINHSPNFSDRDCRNPYGETFAPD